MLLDQFFSSTSYKIFHELAPRVALELRKAQEVDTQDLLIAIFVEGTNEAAKAMKAIGITQEALIQALPESAPGFQRPQGYREPGPSSKISYSVFCRNAANASKQEAEKHKQNNGFNTIIAPEHILLALLAVPSYQAFVLLGSMKVDVQKLRKALLPADTAGPAKPSNSAQNSGMLDKYGTDLTAKALAGELDPVIGRDREIDDMLDILGRRTKNNPIVVGEPGVGKTALLNGLAQRLADGNVPKKFQGKRVFLLDLAGVIAGAKYRGEFEERIKGVLEAVVKSNIILCIDEIHTLIGSGAAEGSMDGANLLKPALGNGLQCVGSTTRDEYTRYIEKNAALARRFQKVVVNAPTVEESITILLGLKEHYEAHHGLKIDDAAVIAAARLSDRYINDRSLPDKAIDVIDEAASHLCNAAGPQGTGDMVLTEADIATVITRYTGVPISQLTQSESERLLNLEHILHKRVIGQEDAIKAVSEAVRRSRSGLTSSKNKKPMACFLFNGPTGVGKTELAKAVAASVFGAEENMIRLDMSEYMERHNVAKLIGSPPGYVGYDDPGQLTDAVRRRPYSVVLFDEIEKAHPDVFNLLLQIMDDGRLTDSKGRTVDFSNTMIILTSNVGSRDIETRTSRGGLALNHGQDEIEQEETSYQRMSAKLNESLRQVFRPELLNRFTAIVTFRQLTRNEVGSIIELLLNEIRSAPALVEKDLKLELTDGAKEKLLDEGYDVLYGARALRRTITNLVETPLAIALLENQFGNGEIIAVDCPAQKDGERGELLFFSKDKMTTTAKKRVRK